MRLFIWATITVLSTVAAAQSSGLTPRQLADMQSITHAHLSPDGKLVAAVRSVPRQLFTEDDGKAWSELLVIDLASGDQQPFVTGPGNVGQVQWRPDGRAMSFVAERGDDEHGAVYEIPVNGGEARRLVGMDEAVLAHVWHPGGTRVAVIAKQAKPADIAELEEQGFTQEVFEEDYRHRRLFIVDLADTTESPRHLEVEGSVFQARWSPQGDRLAVAVAPSPLVDDRYMRQRILVISAADGAVLARVDHEGKLGEVRWSPDGRNLAFVAGVDIHDPSPQSLFVVPAGGGPATNLTAGQSARVESVAWSGADTLLALVSRGVTTDILRVARDGSASESLGLGDDGIVLHRFSSRSGCDIAAGVGSSSEHPAEAFAIDLGDEPTGRRLTTTNPWLDNMMLGRQEVVRWAARDDLELEGLLVHPLDTDGPAPLVVVVHGGPEGHRSHGWLTSYSSPAQILAARGFATFFPNYRGSTGRGVGFSKLGQGDAAGAEFDDIVDAVDHLVAIGVADPDRVGVTGGSYGGYATAWLTSRYSDRFAAGAMFVGISNKISKFGTTDIANEEALVHALRNPWDDWQFALERSPIFHAQKNRTPLLILHGEDDPRVSVTQSKEMYRALKVIGRTPVRLVLYPGEGHGNQRAASRYDYCLRLLRWMEHYLRGPGGDPPPYNLDYAAD